MEAAHVNVQKRWRELVEEMTEATEWPPLWRGMSRGSGDGTCPEPKTIKIL